MNTIFDFVPSECLRRKAPLLRPGNMPNKHILETVRSADAMRTRDLPKKASRAMGQRVKNRLEMERGFIAAVTHNREHWPWYLTAVRPASEDERGTYGVGVVCSFRGTVIPIRVNASERQERCFKKKHANNIPMPSVQVRFANCSSTQYHNFLTALTAMVKECFPQLLKTN